MWHLAGAKQEKSELLSRMAAEMNMLQEAKAESLASAARAAAEVNDLRRALQVRSGA